MGASAVGKVIRVKCRLIKDPTDLSLAFPYGGTELGLTRRVVWRVQPIRGDITAEEYHGAVVETLQGAKNAIVTCVLSEYDPDAYSTLWEGVTTATASGHPLLVHTMTTQRGELGSDRAVSILIVPQATEEHPALYFPRAIPLIDESADIAHQLPEEWGVPCVYRAIPDATGRVFIEGVLEDITL